MQNDEYFSLAQIRLDRAKELIDEAEVLLANESYKSANNRAYYSIEKSLSALLAVSHTLTQTHKGCLLQFNQIYVRTGLGGFNSEDYRLASNAEQIRNASDYDDFYITGKQEAGEQVEAAKYLYDKVLAYIISPD